jgi:thiol-disulfide isomerase/thioredoxin
MTKKLFAALAVLFMVLAAGGAAEAKKFPKFSTKDLDGDVITSDIFAESEITMINFWATWCPPCIAEMPDLAELDDFLDDHPGALIGILLDAEDRGAIQRAEEILEDAEAYFTNLRPSKEMKSILDTIDAVPTSIFVDSGGNIVGPTVVGARNKNEYLRAMLSALEEANKSRGR